MRVMRNFIIICLFMVSFCYADNNRQLVVMKGYVNEDDLRIVQDKISLLHDQKDKSLVIMIDSASADMRAVLEIAKRLYEAKIEDDLEIICYIDGNAVGPTAILPFMADELVVSLSASWGDIIKDSVISQNILRSRINSLIPTSKKDARLLMKLAESMIDSAIIVQESSGQLKFLKEDSAISEDIIIISPAGETLILNQNQIYNHKLSKASMGAVTFQDYVGVENGSEYGFEEKDGLNLSSLVRPSELVKKDLYEHITYSNDKDNVVGKITIDDYSSGINQSTWLYVKSALDYYKNSKPAFIILELNTPGGEVFAAQKISDALQDIDTQYNIPVIAYVNDWAISAGAMLAYSCRYITVDKDAVMGAAEPVLTSGGEMKTASEKINSALRADFSGRAGFYERDPLIAEAMVDKDMILVLRNEKIIQLKDESQIKAYGYNPDIIITTKGKLLTLNSQKMLEYGLADFIVPPKQVKAVTSSEKDAGRWPGSKEMLLKHHFFNGMDNWIVDKYTMDWRMKFFSFLAHPMVASMLFLVLMIGAYTEFTTPGFGVPGIAAMTALFLILLSSFSIEAINWLEVILLLAGLILFAVEIFILPGFGLAGILGITLTFAGLLALLLPGLEYVNFDFTSNTFNVAGQALIERFMWLCGALVLGVIIIAILSRYVLPRFNSVNKLVLKGSEEHDKGYYAGLKASELPKAGTPGVVEAVLRPSGKVIIDKVSYDAISRGEFIAKGNYIEVLEIENGHVVVHKRSE